jgi:site-specific DNA recombinase
MQASGNEHKRAALYGRVSTDEQAEHGYSLQTQLEQCRQYATERGFSVDAEITDDCSGATLERPGLDRLRVMVERREIDAVTVYDPDRLSRDDVDFLIVCREWERAGIALHFVNGGELPNTPEGDIVRYLMGWKGKRERKAIIERTMRGKHAKARAGKWVGGKAPYGFCKVGVYKEARLMIDPFESEIYRRIFEWYNGTGKERLNLRQIVERLAAEGIPTPQGGRIWHVEIVKRLIGSRACLGEFTFAGHTIKMPELAIIDLEVWEAAQKRRKRNKELAKRNRKYEFLLAGHIRCKCGSAIIGNTARCHYKGKEYLYLQYICPHQYRAPRRLLRACDAKPLDIIGNKRI